MFNNNQTCEYLLTGSCIILKLSLNDSQYLTHLFPNIHQIVTRPNYCWLSLCSRSELHSVSTHTHTHTHTHNIMILKMTAYNFLKPHCLYLLLCIYLHSYLFFFIRNLFVHILTALMGTIFSINKVLLIIHSWV